jgi:Methylase involved in ubiquinone/menaquinone biosynthesis
MAFKDHFSTQAATYAAARPTYPAALFSFLAAQSPAMETALDVATGNGQAALGLAPHFTRVIACDASQAQIDNAQPADNVTYHCAGADALPVEDDSIDLITVAQALHWFPLDEFYAEVRRVLKPGGLIAAISYGVQQFDDLALNAAINELYEGVLGDYWPPERFHIETEYRAAS